MSSYTRKMGETIRAMEMLKLTLKSNANTDEYSRGLYNGFEFGLAMLSNREGVIVENKTQITVEPPSDKENQNDQD